MTTVEVLRKARGLIASPEAWTRGTLARDKDGNYVQSGSDTAVQWCASGAILAAADAPEDDEHDDCAVDERAVEALRVMFNQVSKEEISTISGWNDAPGRTHEEIISGFDAAIEAAS